MIGITGTNGKTTSSYMLASILKNAGKKVGVIGTLGIVYNEKRIASQLTTPDPIELHAYLADMVASGIEYVVMEVSAHSLHYKKMEGIHFCACIFTNFTQDHLDFFKSMDSYKKAKMKLFSSEKCSVAIINGDDEVGREIGRLREESGENVIFYGLTMPADCFAIVTDESMKGTDCIFNLNDDLYRVSLHMIGEYNVYNALASASCAQALQCEKGISSGLYRIKGVEGRLQKVEGSPTSSEVYVDFAHTPDGLKKSLETLKRYCKGRLICLFGCGGNRDKGKRKIMGEVAARLCDFAVLTSDNPRYEDPLDIIDEIEKGYRSVSNHYVVVPNREKAIEYALDYCREKDVLLMAGKGGEDYQEIMGIKYPFNDQDMVIRILRQKGKI
jgi:UDP-N-acetylmuramoyl-L-alanyl-D-glutamate--2,6-diaminopimelate ligase